MSNRHISKEDQKVIREIVNRAEKIACENGIDFDRLSMSMDVTSCHLNGCPLDLEKLLTFNDANFGHDVFGIRRFIDRNTGELDGCFSPRCSLPENVAK